MKKFTTYEQVANMKPCQKTATALAIQINEPFRVESLEGDYAQGKVGDYLMKGVNDELYICDQDIFNKSYKFLSGNEI